VFLFTQAFHYPEFTDDTEAGCGVSKYSLPAIFFLIINTVLINEKAGLALTLKNGDYWMVYGLVEFLGFAAAGPLNKVRQGNGFEPVKHRLLPNHPGWTITPTPFQNWTRVSFLKGPLDQHCSVPHISYVQSQVPKVLRYPVRIQTSLLFVVPRSGGTASK